KKLAEKVAEINQLKAELDSLSKRLGASNEDYAKLEKLLKEATDGFSDEKKNLAEFKKKNGELETSLNSEKGKNSTLTSAKSDLEKKLSDLNALLSREQNAHQTTRDNLTKQIEAKETEISLHVSEKTRALKAEKSAQDKIKDYETKLATQQKEY